MDIFLAAERAFHLIPQVTIEVARDRVEQKKLNLVSGTLGALLSRPKPEDILFVSLENRLEPYWQMTVFVRTVYDRTQTYSIQVSGREVQQVTALGHELPVSVTPKGTATIALNGVEHCLEEHRHPFSFDGTGVKTDVSRYQSFAKSEISDLGQFTPAGVLVVPPQAQASTIMRTVLSEVIKPVQAQVIHEERVDVEVLEINFRPVYAFEYEWVSKGKHAVLEFDGMTGEIHSGGKKLTDQMRGIMTRDLIFDITADAAGMILPGGGIAVKLVKAVVDRNK
jgi:hypothetical protein